MFRDIEATQIETNLVGGKRKKRAATMATKKKKTLATTRIALRGKRSLYETDETGTDAETVTNCHRYRLDCCFSELKSEAIQWKWYSTSTYSFSIQNENFVLNLQTNLRR